MITRQQFQHAVRKSEEFSLTSTYADGLQHVEAVQDYVKRYSEKAPFEIELFQGHGANCFASVGQARSREHLYRDWAATVGRTLIRDVCLLTNYSLSSGELLKAINAVGIFESAKSNGVADAFVRRVIAMAHLGRFPTICTDSNIATLKASFGMHTNKTQGSRNLNTLLLIQDEIDHHIQETGFIPANLFIKVIIAGNVPKS